MLLASSTAQKFLFNGHWASNLTTQKSSYSDYKSHTTVKYLVAIDTFTGPDVFIYVSHGFSGSSSDRFTIPHSGILDELKQGQQILADIKATMPETCLHRRGAF